MLPQEFLALYGSFCSLRQSGLPHGAALATLVRTRGAAFRRPGARMLVAGDGSIIRGLSAGCPDADIAAHGVQAIANSSARVLRYDREHGFDAMLEMGCGGELEIMIEPLRAASDLDFVDAVHGCLLQRRSGVLLTVFGESGLCLPRPRRLVWSNGILFDDLGDSVLKKSLLAMASAIHAQDSARLEQIESPGGPAQVFIEPLIPVLQLVILGTGPVAMALARLGLSLNWQVVLVDHRDDSEVTGIEGAELRRASPQQLRDRCTLDPRTAVVALTHNFERDLAYLRALSAEPLAYAGALGSRGRAQKMREALAEPARHLHSPAGLDIGSETPEEVALAIAAEIQAVTNGHGGGHLYTSAGPIH